MKKLIFLGLSSVLLSATNLKALDYSPNLTSTETYTSKQIRGIITIDNDDYVFEGTCCPGLNVYWWGPGGSRGHIQFSPIVDDPDNEPAQNYSDLTANYDITSESYDSDNNPINLDNAEEIILAAYNGFLAE